ncbi:MAG: hypothetical protein ACYSUS_08225, partial [Planctomycetota bacterium]
RMIRINATQRKMNSATIKLPNNESASIRAIFDPQTKKPTLYLFVPSGNGFDHCGKIFNF